MHGRWSSADGAAEYSGGWRDGLRHGEGVLFQVSGARGGLLNGLTRSLGGSAKPEPHAHRRRRGRSSSWAALSTTCSTARGAASTPMAPSTRASGARGAGATSHRWGLGGAVLSLCATRELPCGPRARCRHGVGKLVHGASWYQGQWQDDRQHGVGTHCLDGGERYVGEAPLLAQTFLSVLLPTHPPAHPLTHQASSSGGCATARGAAPTLTAPSTRGSGRPAGARARAPARTPTATSTRVRGGGCSGGQRVPCEWRQARAWLSLTHHHAAPRGLAG